MFNIEKDLISNTSYKYGTANQKRFIVVHQTGNRNIGAGAEAHARLQELGNRRPASWHLQVDSKKAIQSFDYDFQLWHAGDGEGEGNLHGIAVEICINKDDDYEKAIQNAVEVVKQLMHDFDIPIYRVKQHHAFSGKNCPAQIRANYKGIDWNDFIDAVKDKPKVNKDTSQKPKAQDTNSIVDFLSANKRDASYDARKKLADEHGISNYRGTAYQNLLLLKKLRGGVKPTSNSTKPSKKKYTKGMNETSIVDFLKKNKEESSYEHRKTIAKSLGIKGYRGTASQNKDLLETLKKM